MTFAPFTSAELTNPRTYVVAWDVREAKGFALEHAAELWQRRSSQELSPTLVALLELMRPIRGLRGGRDGMGLQASIDELADTLGKSRSVVASALNEGAEKGLLRRFAPIRSVRNITKHRARPADDFEDADGNVRKNANVKGVLYLTLRGARALEPFGWTRKRHRGRTRRVTVRTGLVGSLLASLSAPLRAASRRCASQPKNRTPIQDRGLLESTIPGTAGADRAARVRPGAHDGTGPPEPDSAHDARGRGAGSGGGSLAAEVARCWANYNLVGRYTAPRPESLGFGYEARLADPTAEFWAPILTAAAWRPEEWRRGDAEHRAWLTRKFEPIRAELVARIQRGEVP